MPPLPYSLGWGHSMSAEGVDLHVDYATEIEPHLGRRLVHFNLLVICHLPALLASLLAQLFCMAMQGPVTLLHDVVRAISTSLAAERVQNVQGNYSADSQTHCSKLKSVRALAALTMCFEGTWRGRRVAVEMLPQLAVNSHIKHRLTFGCCLRALVALATCLRQHGAAGASLSRSCRSWRSAVRGTGRRPRRSTRR